MFDNIGKSSGNRRACAAALYIFLWVLLMLPVSGLGGEQNSIATLKEMGKAFTSIAEKASPAVVAIRVESTVTQRYYDYEDSPFGNDLFEFFFFRRRPQRPIPQPKQRRIITAQGSGFIISADGYVLTSNHLVGDAEKVVVELGDGRKFTARRIGTDPDSDVAVIRIDANELPYIEMADSDALEVGEWVLAIGNPLGLSHTVTAGIVSAKGRSGFGLANLENFIQTDAAINFGNSGGPLINLDGEVVGINTAIVGSAGNIGIGFAIPINMAKNIYQQLKTTGRVERAFLGVLPQDMDADMAEAFGLPNSNGVLIPQVDKGSAADRAGLRHNDVILEFDGHPVRSANELRNRIAMLSPGTRVKIVVWRDGKRKTVTAKLGRRTIDTLDQQGTAEDILEELGFTVQNFDKEAPGPHQHQDQSGVVISSVQPGSQADRANLMPGMLIKEVNQKPVNDVTEFHEAIKKAKSKGTAVLLVKHETLSFYVLFTL